MDIDRAAGGLAGDGALAEGLLAGSTHLRPGSSRAWTTAAVDLVVAALRDIGLETRVVGGDQPVAVVATIPGVGTGPSIALAATVHEDEGTAYATPAPGVDREALARTSLGDVGWPALAAVVVTAARLGRVHTRAGDTHIHLGVQSSGTAAGTSAAAVLSSAPRPDAVIASASIVGSMFELVTAVPGVIDGYIDIDGKVTHCGSRPSSIRPGGLGDAVGVNALEKAMRVIAALRDLEDQWLVAKTHAHLPPASATIGVTSFDADAGYPFPAYFPDRARIGLRATYLPGETAEAVRDEIEAYVLAASALDPWLRAHPPRCTWHPGSPAMSLPPAHPLARCLAEELASRPSMAPAANPGQWSTIRSEGPSYAVSGIATVLVGVGPADGSGPGSQAGSTEAMAVADVLTGAATRWHGAGDDE